MGKNSWTHGRLIRSEQSGNLDGNESNRIFELQFDRSLDPDSAIEGDDAIPNLANSEMLMSDKPIAIKEYKVTVACNDLLMLHQYYGDENQIYEWNTTNELFHSGLKQWVMIPGAKQKYAVEWQRDALPENIDGVDVTELEHTNQYGIRTLHFDTDYIKRRGKKGYWKNGLRPIILSQNKGKRFGFTVSNLSGNANAFFYAVVEIKRWSILD